MRINPDPEGERRAEVLRRLQGKAPRARRRRRLVPKLLIAWLLLTLLPVLLWRAVDPPLTAFMLAEWLAARSAARTDFSLQHRAVPLAQIALPMRAAVVAAEDQRFLQHHGFDVAAIRAAWAEARAVGHPVHGGSTITQQLAKNLFLWSDRHWLRKGLEAWFTVLIELSWPKSRILEVYLNVVQFGEGLYGVEAASQRYFGHGASTLTGPEAALLAAVLPNPIALRVEAPSSYLRERQRWILGQMGQ